MPSPDSKIRPIRPVPGSVQCRLRSISPDKIGGGGGSQGGFLMASKKVEHLLLYYLACQLQSVFDSIFFSRTESLRYMTYFWIKELKFGGPDRILPNSITSSG